VREYDAAVANFLKGIEVAPSRASLRKDLGYTSLKIGENELAREQFREAVNLEPGDVQVSMEYALLCYETKQHVQARRIFDRISGRETELPKAFHNIDDPLGTGITRWKEAIANGADNFSAHFELASLAELTQLGFQLKCGATLRVRMPLFERVLAGADEELAHRVRAVSRMP
jgi:tetratricopeptide (TPR) repeat protein